MNFTSDNAWGVAPEIMVAMDRVNGGAVGSYGGDDLTKQLELAFSQLFETEVAMFLVPTGTAANALAAAAYCPPYGAIFCHDESHIYADEIGAAEFYSGGAKLLPLPGDGGLIDAGYFGARLKAILGSAAHHSKPMMLSVTQGTECGRVYSLDAIAEVTRIAKTNGLATHMDGARFANAIASIGCSPADATWKAGIDAISFGATKNGCMGAEALIFFDGLDHSDVAARRMRGGLLMSKSRFLAAQILAYLENGLWLELASRANERARKLGEGIGGIKSARLAWPVEINEVFAVLSTKQNDALRAAGAKYHAWANTGPSRAPVAGEGEVLVRLVASPETPMEEVDAFLSVLGSTT